MRRFFLWLVIIIFAVPIVLVFSIANFEKQGILTSLVPVNRRPLVSDFIFSDTYGSLPKIVSWFSGFDRPRYFLVLLQNNTELRPTGGFIGSFAVVRVTSAKPEVLWIDDSYNIDRFAQGKMSEPAPEPFRTLLKVPQWYFRDANWDPNFPSSAAKAVDLFFQEIEYRPQKLPTFAFDGVIAVTPELISETIRILGPLRVEGVEYAADTFTEQLEERVEYDYQSFGEEKYERKQVLGLLAKDLREKVVSSGLSQKIALYQAVMRLLEEKHILVFSTDKDVQMFLTERGYGGEVQRTTEDQDYFFVIDANMGSLKTDAVMEREVEYSLASGGSSAKSVLLLRYINKGVVADWKTKAYQSYTRVYLAPGVRDVTVGRRISSEQTPPEEIPFVVEEENGKVSIAFTVSVPLLGMKEYVISYIPPEKVQSRLKKGKYSLILQKQPGTKPSKLNVDIKIPPVVKSWNREEWTKDEVFTIE
jgi:hypothetical protein